MRTPPNEGAGLDQTTPVRPERSTKREVEGSRRNPSDEHASTALGTNDSDDEGTGPTRTCILSRRSANKSELIRLVLGPDNQVHPDVRARAPGRGAWLGVTRGELETALAKGKLKAALARAFRTRELEIAPDLPDRIEQALARTTLDRLGMEARSGTLINGADRVEQAARAGKVHLLLHAADAGADGRRKLDQAWRVGGSEEVGRRTGLEIPVDRTILSMALGRENVVHAALTDRGAAARVLEALTRWRAFIVGHAGLGRGELAAGHGTADE
jgi:predicted RNA-binding protein YlxR (DUF448 family)